MNNAQRILKGFELVLERLDVEAAGQSEKGQDLEAAAERLGELIEALDEAGSALETLTGKLLEVAEGDLP